MSLESWLAEGWVKRTQASPDQIRQLLESSERHLKSASSEAIESDWRLAMAYQATLNLAAAALNSCKFRVRAVGHHYWLIESLRHTLGIEPDLLATLHHFREARHLVLYEGRREITELEANEMMEIASDLRLRLLSWLQVNHPQMLD